MRFIKNKFGIATLIGFTCIFFYAFFWSGIHYSIDGIVTFEYAKALLFQHSFSMEPPVVWNGMQFRVSRWAIGQTLAYVPFLWVLSKTIFSHNPSFTNVPYNPSSPMNPKLLENTAYRSVSFMNPLITTATVLVLFLLLIDLGFSKRKASIIALIYGLASPAAAYAKYDFSQPLAAFWLIISFWLLIKAQKTDHIGYYFLSGVTSGGLIITRTELLVFQIPLMIGFVFLANSKDEKIYTLTNSKVRKIVLFCLPIFIMVGINQYLNYARFGGWFDVGYNTRSMFRPDMTALVGNLVSPGRGLFIFFPLAWLSILSFRQFKGDRILWVMFISAFGAILFYSLFNDGWSAGVCWGPRLLIPYIPFYAILGSIGFEEIKLHFHTLSIILFMILTTLGAIFTFQGLLFNPLIFYGNLAIKDQDIINGLYNFSVKYSPIFSGWGKLLSPKEYDIYWFQHPMAFNGASQIILFSIVAALGVILSIWVVSESNIVLNKTS